MSPPTATWPRPWPCSPHAQQDAIWRRTKAGNELRTMLREYYPTFLEAFVRKSTTNLASPGARATGATLSKTRIATALRRPHPLRRPDRHQQQGGAA